MAKRRARKESLAQKGLGNVFKALMLLSGIGIFYRMYSEMQASGAVPTQLLAPPLPALWPYVFIAVILVGTVYFIAKAIKRKKMSEIPLSF
jgi:hypothetical protein